MADARRKELKLALAETKARVEALAHERHAAVVSRGALQAEPHSQAVSEIERAGLAR